jgi:mannose-6-phosphate isomerase
MSHAPLPALLLEPNPVWRSYRGGSVLRAFRGHPGTPDDHFPEDWLASTVPARNGPYSQGPDEGISFVAWNGRRATVAELLGLPAMGVLIKLLDAFARLQLQAHPSRPFVRQNLYGDAGKTECWYILSTRGPAQVYLGFQRPPGRAEWKRLMQEQDVAGMLACFDPVPVQPGDCFVVPAGVPHAIGAGIFMVELQEPSDWVVRCEARNGELVLPEEQRYMGLGLEACLDVFDYGAYATRPAFQQPPRILTDAGSFIEEQVIGSDYESFFRLRRLRGTGPARWKGGEVMVMIITKGEGILRGQSARRGQTWLLPEGVSEWHWEAEAAAWEILLAQPPRKGV